MRWLVSSWSAFRDTVLFTRDRLLHEGDAESLAFDEARGVETSRWTLAYEPCPPSLVERVLDTSPVPLPGRAFVDLGCGKGRVLLIAARRPFARALGVEVDPDLHASCVRNLARPDEERRCPVDAVWQDAAEVALPREPLIVFLYNPFEDDVLARVAEALARRPDTAIAYVHPVYAQVLDEAGWSLRHEEGEGPARFRWYTRGEVR